MNIVQGGLGLPDEAYYREDAFAELRAKYVAHVAAMLRLVGYTERAADDGADRVMALETRLAAAHWDKVRSRDVHGDLQPHDPRRPARRGTRLRLAAVDRRRSAAPRTQFAEVLVRQPSYLPGAVRGARPRSRSTDWKVWLTFHLVRAPRPT